jgi:hypothetical protein
VASLASGLHDYVSRNPDHRGRHSRPPSVLASHFLSERGK